MLRTLRYQTISCLLALVLVASAQVLPSNSTTDIPPFSSLPVYIANSVSSAIVPPFLVGLLGFSGAPRNTFLSYSLTGRLVNTGTGNADRVHQQDLCLVSCDVEDYADGNLNATDVLRLIANARTYLGVIMYSTRSNHCVFDQLMNTPAIQPLFTTLDPISAAQVVGYDYTEGQQAYVTLSPDSDSYTNATGTGSSQSSAFSPAPTTAIAMVILYSITGIITALFVVIIVTGAIRAHRHPERYGPRNIAGRGRQSRARGLARAMLETLPIVKFGDHEDSTKPGTATAAGDIEMNNNNDANRAPDKSATETITADKSGAAITTATGSASEHEDGKPSASSSSLHPTPAIASNSTNSEAPAVDDDNSLSCSICTEDFQRGEEVRVLPCNHKFHPECVDPWLLNVSGTCPLCRIDLRPANSENDEDDNGNGAPPLVGMGGTTGHGSSTLSSLRAIAAASGSLSREERIAALRRIRQERRRSNRNSVSGVIQLEPQTEEERRGLARRFRERFRVRTMRQAQDGDGPMRSGSTAEAADAAEARAAARFFSVR